MNLTKRCHCPAKCDHPWHYRFELAGRTYRGTTKTPDRKKALASAMAVWDRTRARGFGEDRLDPAPLLAAYITTYVEWARGDHPATAERKDKRVLASLLSTVGNKPLDRISQFDIERWRTARARKVERSTVNRELNVIRGAFTKAVEWRKLAASPVKGVSRYRGADSARIRVLTREEIGTILLHAPAELALICRVTLECLPRLSEVLNILRSDIGPSWVQIRRKGGKFARIPISPALREALLARPVYPSDALFVRSQEATSLAFTRLFRKLGLEGVSHHVMRHTGVTLMLDAGMNPQAIQKLAGWTSLRMLEKYGHVNDAEARRAIEANAAIVASAQTPSHAEQPTKEESAVTG